MKMIFTWWNKQTFGTFLKTLFFGKYVGSDELGNKYYKSKKKRTLGNLFKKYRGNKNNLRLVFMDTPYN